MQALLDCVDEIALDGLDGMEKMQYFMAFLFIEEEASRHWLQPLLNSVSIISDKELIQIRVFGFCPLVI